MTNKQRIASGRKAFTHYCDQHKLEPVERKQHYTATDLVADVLHYAASRGWDVETILASAGGHFAAERGASPDGTRRCGCCGAVEGRRHHDAGYRHLTVTLAYNLKQDRLLCQPCAQGLAELEAEQAAAQEAK